MGDSSTPTFGKYQLIAELGHGGMADVFLAVRAGPVGSGFSKLTVVKRLRPNLADEQEFVEMLVDEARIAARLNHPNVVQTNEVGEVDHQYFIAMEYLDGQPFHRIQHRVMQRAKDGSPPLLTREQQVLVLMDALAGLHHAHELKDYDGADLKIVHRDVTPHNIFVTYEGQVKVVDFGIAKAVGRASETRQGVVKGKVRYMAPEQALGREVDRTADVFAAGILAWEIATGRRMWKNQDDLGIVQGLISGDLPPSPREIDPTVPEALDRICKRALKIVPSERYATAEEFRIALEEYLAESGQLVDARRKLPSVLSQLFKDKRAEIRSVIEKQLSLLNARPSAAEFRAVSLPADSPSSRTPTALAIEEDPTQTTGLTDQKTEIYDGDRQQGPRRLSAPASIAIAAVAAAACISGFIAWRGTSHNSVAVAAPPEEHVSIRVTGTPSTAHVRIDDGPPQNIPLDVSVSRDDREHSLLVEADGYVGKTEKVTFARDLALNLDLVAAEQPIPDPVASVADTKKPRNNPAPRWVVATHAPAPPVTAPSTTAAPASTIATLPTPASSDGKKTSRLGLDKGDPWSK